MTYYPKLGLYEPDAVMVVGDCVTVCFKPDRDQAARAAECWYKDDAGDPSDWAMERMAVDTKRNMFSVPIEWVDYTLIPPLHRK